MARARVRAAVRKAAERQRRGEAELIADGVFHVARETLEGVPRAELPLPVFAWAPLCYASEMVAAVICKEQGWEGDQRQHEVGLYLMTGLQEVLVAAKAGFDVEHFQAWIAAASRQEGVASG